MDALRRYEENFRESFRVVGSERIGDAGALLRVIPSREEWVGFTADVKSAWPTWERQPEDLPHCMVVLYGGVAFFDYRSNKYWAQFAAAVGEDEIPVNQQAFLNRAYAKAVESVGLRMRTGHQRGDFIGTAVYHVGVPLSLWDDFLQLCEWACWHKELASMPPEEWAAQAAHHASRHPRLVSFLRENPLVAMKYVQDMVEAREVLMRDNALKFDDLKQLVSINIRPEYFDEVPETADFLRPDDPDSILGDRAGICFVKRQDARSIILHLPGIPREKLPGSWRLGEMRREGNANADELRLDGAVWGMDGQLIMEAKGGEVLHAQHIRGLGDWGLFDLESRGQLVASGRERLPLREHVLVARDRIDIAGSGFESFDEQANVEYRLTDGSSCFITRLWPAEKVASLEVRRRGASARVRFESRARVRARFFAGQGAEAVHFQWSDGHYKMEKPPVLVLEIPSDFFVDPDQAVKKHFRVLVDADVASGVWERHETSGNNDYFIWRWDERPRLQIRSGRINSLSELRNHVSAPAMRGAHTLRIISDHCRFEVEYQVFIDVPRSGLDECWADLPGAFLPWFILCQSREGMDRDEIVLARRVIAPKGRLSPDTLDRSLNLGLLRRDGRRWRLGASRAIVELLSETEVQVRYCGDPCVVWGLYRRMFYAVRGQGLPRINVVANRGELPYLQMLWHREYADEIYRYLERHEVVVGKSLWNP